VARSVLLVAEVPIRGGSPLIGQPLADIEQLREVRVLGLGRRGEKWVDWAPRSNSKLAEDDQPVVVATRAGLNRLVERSISDGYGNGGSPVP
jgi:Trk K+ transport system NAD-binding subunit